jgi:hypothetical protein
MAAWNEYKRVHGLDHPAPEVLNPPKKKRPPPPNLYKPIIAKVDERSPGIASTPVHHAGSRCRLGCRMLSRPLLV